MVLVYINPLNKNYKGEFIYEFLFSKNIEINFGEDWDVQPASSGILTPPPLDDIKKIGLLKTTEIELDLTILSDNFSMINCVEDIVAIGWEKEPPDDETRLVFHFGEDMENVQKKLYARDIIINITDKE